MIKKNKTMIMSIFIALFMILLFINVYLYLYNPAYKLTFSELFQKLADAPKIDNTNISLYFSDGIVADWGVFNFLKEFINGLWQIVGVILYVCIQIANSMVFVFELIKSLFIGVLG